MGYGSNEFLFFVGVLTDDLRNGVNENFLVFERDEVVFHGVQLVDLLVDDLVELGVIGGSGWLLLFLLKTELQTVQQFLFFEFFGGPLRLFFVVQSSFFAIFGHQFVHIVSQPAVSALILFHLTHQLHDALVQTAFPTTFLHWRIPQILV